MTRFGYACAEQAAADVNLETGGQLAEFYERDGVPEPPVVEPQAPEPPPAVIDLRSAQVPVWSQGRWERVPRAEWPPLEVLWCGGRARLSNGNGRVALARRQGVSELGGIVTAQSGQHPCRVLV